MNTQLNTKPLSDNSFSTTTTVERSTSEVFDAICRPRDWWWSSIHGSADTVGDEFVFDLPGHHVWKMRVIELTRPERVVWRVTDDSSTEFVADHVEWNGTTVIFDIEPVADGSRIRFTHNGLVPSLECFSGCSTGWTHYIQSSLRTLLTTGTGQPGEF